MSIPADLVEPPARVRALARGASLAPVWRNDYGGLTFATDDGRWLAHVDLGALGVADRWADIAVAAMSTEWNYGPGWEDALIEAYGVDPDRERLSYYRELWNAT